MNGPRVLVTGATGFVGRALCEELDARGFRVRAVVRDRARAGALPGEIVTVAQPLHDADWSGCMRGIDSVVHLAARVHIMKDTAAEPLREFRAVNVDGTQALAHAAVAARVKRFVFVSSIKVNGEETRERAFSAEDEAAPQDPYGVSKWEAECSLRRIAEDTSLEVTVVRPPLVYGPRVSGNFLRLLKLIDLGFPLPFGAVVNRRSMIYSRNLADALIACAVHPNAANKTFLTSDREDLSTSDLIARMAAALGRSARCFRVPLSALTLAGRCAGKTAEMRRLISSLVVDSDRISSELGWRPRFSVRQGLADTAEWYRTERVKSSERGI